MVHMKDGRIRLGERDNDVLTRINQVIQARGSTTSSLQSFAVRDAHLAVFDENTGLSLTARSAETDDILLTGRSNTGLVPI